MVKFRWKLWRHFHRKDISNSCDVLSPSLHPMKHSDWAREIFRWEQKVLIIRSKLLESQLVKQQRLPALSITLVGEVEEAMKLSRDEVLRRMYKSFHLGYKKAHAFSWIYSKAVQIFSFAEMIPFSQISCDFFCYHVVYLWRTLFSFEHSFNIKSKLLLRLIVDIWSYSINFI